MILESDIGKRSKNCYKIFGRINSDRNYLITSSIKFLNSVIVLFLERKIIQVIVFTIYEGSCADDTVILRKIKWNNNWE